MSLLTGFLKTKSLSADGRAYLSVGQVTPSELFGLDDQIYMNQRMDDALKDPNGYKAAKDAAIVALKADVDKKYPKVLEAIKKDNPLLPESKIQKLALREIQAHVSLEMDKINKKFPTSFGGKSESVSSLLDRRAELKKLGAI